MRIPKLWHIPPKLSHRHHALQLLLADASSETLARMGSEQTIWAAAGVLRAWIQEHDIPVALYTDWKNVYSREASVHHVHQATFRTPSLVPIVKTSIHLYQLTYMLFPLSSLAMHSLLP